MSDTSINEKNFEAVVKAVMNGVTAGQLANVSEETLESLYALAYGLYSSGNYTDARTAFQALCLLSPKDERFWMGLGGSCQGLERYENAFDAYQMAAISTSLKNPEPLLYGVQCLLKLNRKEDAIAGLQALLDLGDKDHPKTAQCREKAKALLALLEKGE